MKNLVAIFILLAGVLSAQKPEKVNRYSRQWREPEFYKTQFKLWKTEVEKNPKDAAAWQNYFLAARYVDFEGKMMAGEEKTKLLRKIVADMEKNVPNTAEYYRCKLLDYDTPKDTPENLKLVEKGLAIAPGDPDMLEDYVNYCELNGQTEKLKGLYEGLNKARVIDYGIMEFNYNMLMSVDKNGILFTFGDNDTYPARILQEVKGVRKDVTVINTSLGTYFPNFTKRLLKEKGIVLSDDFLKKGSTMSTKDFIKELMLELNKKAPGTPLFVAACGDISGFFEDSLYCTGLAYQFSTKKTDNLAKLKMNVESRFHLDYLKGGLYENNGISKEIVEGCNSNYTVAFGMLYKHYRTMNEKNEKSEFYKGFCLEMAAKNGSEKEVKTWLEGD